MEGFVGEIKIFGGSYAPVDWLFCNGQVLSIQTNTPLYAIIGTQYGGDGRTTFALPNLQGEVVMGQGAGPGLTVRDIGDTESVNAIVLNQNSIPPHTHTLQGSSTASNTPNVANAFLGSNAGRATPRYVTAPIANVNTLLAPGSISPAGSQSPTALSIMQPYLTLNFIICTSGEFPQRP